jgi:translation initiation factor IF-2
MLKQKGVKFCVALNKIDRLNQWKAIEGMNSRDTLKAQGAATQ